MPSSKELELERQALMLEMAGKIDVIYQLLTAATIGNKPIEEEKVERKNSKKVKKTKWV